MKSKGMEFVLQGTCARMHGLCGPVVGKKSEQGEQKQAMNFYL